MELEFGAGFDFSFEGELGKIVTGKTKSANAQNLAINALTLKVQNAKGSARSISKDLSSLVAVNENIAISGTTWANIFAHNPEFKLETADIADLLLEIKPAFVEAAAAIKAACSIVDGKIEPVKGSNLVASIFAYVKEIRDPQNGISIEAANNKYNNFLAGADFLTVQKMALTFTSYFTVAEGKVSFEYTTEMKTVGARFAKFLQLALADFKFEDAAEEGLFMVGFMHTPYLRKPVLKTGREYGTLAVIDDAEKPSISKSSDATLAKMFKDNEDSCATYISEVGIVPLTADNKLALCKIYYPLTDGKFTDKNIYTLSPVDARGNFTEEIGEYVAVDKYEIVSPKTGAKIIIDASSLEATIAFKEKFGEDAGFSLLMVISERVAKLDAKYTEGQHIALCPYYIIPNETLGLGRGNKYNVKIVGSTTIVDEAKRFMTEGEVKLAAELAKELNYASPIEEINVGTEEVPVWEFGTIKYFTYFGGSELAVILGGALYSDPDKYDRESMATSINGATDGISSANAEQHCANIPFGTKTKDKVSYTYTSLNFRTAKLVADIEDQAMEIEIIPLILSNRIVL